MSLILRRDAKKPIPSKHLSEWTRGRVCGWCEKGVPLREISHQLNIPFTNVQNIVARWDQEGKKTEGRGRHPKTSYAQDEAIVEEALKNRHNSYQDMANKIAPDVSEKTIKRWLSKKNLKKWVAQRREHLD